MKNTCIALLATISMLVLSSARADTHNEFWPELDGFFKLDDRTRLFLMTAAMRGEDTETIANGARFQSGQVGAHIDYTLRPIAFFGNQREEDWQQDRYLWVRAGFRRLEYFDDWSSGENRALVELYGRNPLSAGFWLTSRASYELRQIDGEYSNRLGIRMGFERPTSVAGHALMLYAHAETSYDSRFETWNRQRYQAGIEFEINQRWRLEPYFVHQDDNRSSVAQVNAFGLTLKYSR